MSDDVIEVDPEQAERDADWAEAKARAAKVMAIESEHRRRATAKSNAGRNPKVPPISNGRQWCSLCGGWMARPHVHRARRAT